MGKTLSILAFIFSFLMPLVGLILGIIALSQAKNDKDALKGLAIAAIIIGGVLTLLAIIIIVFVVGIWISVLGAGNSEAFIGDKFLIGAPFVAQSISAIASTDSLAFEVVNGGPDTVNVNKILVNACSNNPALITVPDEAQIPSGGASLIYYNPPGGEDCIKPGERLVSAVIFYYTEGASSLEHMVSGSVSVMPK